MDAKDLRALAADHQHIRHHPHEVAAALLAAAELIEHHEKRVADLVNVANAFAAETTEAAADAARYRWLRDSNDWYAEPRLDEVDGTKWELVFYTPQRIEDPTDDDNLDAAVDAAMKEAE